MPEPFRSGFVSILGRPNAGKSTLLNALVGSKVAIVADKPQTTRTSIQGVMHLERAQVVFLDTPGIHKADSAINKRMMEAVRAALDQRDLLLFLHDATLPFRERDRHALELVTRAGAPVLLLLNKIDAVEEKPRLLELIEDYRKRYEFADHIPVSALTGDGIDLVKKAIVERLPEGPPYFPPDHVTDQPERFLAAELIREKIVRIAREEVPHSVTVMIERWEEGPKLTRIYATILVERDGQKKIVIGSGGSVLKRVGTEAREEMELLFGRKIFLDLHVKVHAGWREKPAILDTLDWRTMAGRDDT